MVVPDDALANYRFLKLVGKGAQSKVYMAQNVKTREIKAIKSFRKDLLINNLEALKVEKEVLKSVSHPFITKVESVFVSDHRVYYLMDYYEGGDLSLLIRNH